MYQTMYHPPFRAADFLILRHTAPQYLIILYGKVVFSAAIAGIALCGVGCSILDSLNNPHIVDFSSLSQSKKEILKRKETQYKTKDVQNKGGIRHDNSKFTGPSNSIFDTGNNLLHLSNNVDNLSASADTLG